MSRKCSSSEAQVSEMAESIIQDVAEFLFEDEEFGSSLEVSWCNGLRPQKLWPKSPRMPLCTPSVSKALWTLNPPFHRWSAADLSLPCNSPRHPNPEFRQGQLQRLH